MDIEPQRVCKQRFERPPGFENDLYDAAETVGGDLQAILVGAFDPTDRKPPVCRAHDRNHLDRDRLLADFRKHVGSADIAIQFLGAAIGQMGVGVLPVRPYHDGIAR